MRGTTIDWQVSFCKIWPAIHVRRVWLIEKGGHRSTTFPTPLYINQWIKSARGQPEKISYENSIKTINLAPGMALQFCCYDGRMLPTIHPWPLQNCCFTRIMRWLCCTQRLEGREGRTSAAFFSLVSRLVLQRTERDVIESTLAMHRVISILERHSHFDIFR